MNWGNLVNSVKSFYVFTNKALLLFLLLVFLSIGLKLESHLRIAKNDLLPQADYFEEGMQGFTYHLPRNLNFAQEIVPLYDYKVRERIKKELRRSHHEKNQTILLHKRANRYFPVIEEILKLHRIPDDFKYMVVVESGLTNKVSPKGASGYWQILDNTARAYGLEVNDAVDERYSLEKSTHAACKYLNDSYKQFGNWTLVAASYNRGMGGIQKQLNRQQAETFYNLELKRETGSYIYRILAMKEIISKPANYGYQIRKRDLYPPIAIRRLKVDTSIADLSLFALNQGITYKTLKLMNPWLRKSYLPNPNGKAYIIKIPLPNASLVGLKYEDGSDSLLFASDSARLYNGYLNPPDSVLKPIMHKVLLTETLEEVSKKYKVDPRMIMVWNLLDDEKEMYERKELIIFLSKQKP